ncbi:putative defense protein Hdd11 [Branchiostoma floridae x Branchiostoma belcheri]
MDFNMKTMLAYTVLLSSLLAMARGYSMGVPEEACSTLAPEHPGGSSQLLKTAPFRLEADHTSDTPGAPVKVTISGSRGFKGFMMQAVSTEGAVVGTFQPFILLAVYTC